jgi:hypothetical protein
MARTISWKVVLEVSCRRFFPDDNACRFAIFYSKPDVMLMRLWCHTARLLIRRLLHAIGLLIDRCTVVR